MKEDTPIFEETQQFRQIWLWLILLGVCLPLSYGTFRQLVLGINFGTDPAPDFLLFGIWLLIGIGLPIGFYKAKLITKVYDDRIGIRFYPLHRSEQEFPFDQIERVEAVTYRPIFQYGGWGIRVGWGGKAYNVSGKKGVKLHFSSGRQLLVGSQRPGELAETTNKAMKKHE